MRWLLLLFVLALFAVPMAHAEQYIFDSTLYAAQNLDVNIAVQNNITLQGDVQSLTAELFYYPKPFGGQTVTSLTTTPNAQSTSDSLLYRWVAPRNQVSLLMNSTVHSTFWRPALTHPIPFPYKTVPAAEQPYLQSEPIIQITPQIRQQAAAIVGSETDAVKVTYLLGKWVKDHVRYDLNSVTAKATETSQWVLDNREGVCDELTSLFIAMARAEGIPARFMSGVAYTNLPSLNSNWGPHGWAEVWYPGVGWVPYDVTYGEYGYVDATHISFQATADAKTDAAEYRMLSRGGDFNAGPIARDVTLLDRGQARPSDISVQIAPALKDVGFGGWNRIDVTVHNLQNEYISTELYLARTAHLSTSDYSQSILLAPGEQRTLHWLVQVDPSLRAGYVYTFPVAVSSNTDQTYETNFTARSGGVLATEQQVSVPTEATGSQPLLGNLSCKYPESVLHGQTFTVNCTFPRAVKLCLTSCVTGTSVSQNYTFTSVGVHTIVVSAEEGVRKQQQILSVSVMDQPHINISVEGPSEVNVSGNATLVVHVARDSFSTLGDVKLTLEHPLLGQSWDLGTLDRPVTLDIAFSGDQLTAGTNTLRLVASYDGKTTTDAVEVTPVPHTLWERITLWLNSIVAALGL